MENTKLMRNLEFRGLSLFLKVREKFGNPREQLAEAGITPGQRVLDYGCGIGSYAIPAAQIVGDGGVVYALDIHPLAIEAVERRARKENLENVKTIHSGRDTGLPDESVDAILLYDVLHAVPDKGALLRELHRVLKPGGVLSVVPDHMEDDLFLRTMQDGSLFALQARYGEAYQFEKGPNGRHAGKS
jgi:ubiquinone/menaquinone biosynthesis C-methylase UbiE